MKRSSAALLVMALSTSYIQADQTLIYREETERDVTTTVVTVSEGLRLLELTKRITEETYRETCDAEWNTRSATVGVAGREGIVRRIGDSLVVDWTDGTSNTYPIDGAPWRQNLYRMETFIRNGDSQKSEFWMAAPNFRLGPDGPPQLKTLKFSLKKTGRETCTIEDVEVETIRTELRPEGMAGLFRNAEFWFRESDGLLVKYETAGRVPGMPATSGVQGW